MRMVPPVASDGLCTPFASAAWPPEPPPLPPRPRTPPTPPPAPPPVVPGPPQATTVIAATAPSATAVSRRVLLICTFPWGSSRPGVEGVAQPVTEQVERQHGREDRQTREEHEVRVDLVPVRGVGEHAAPGRGRGPDADPEEGERRLEQDVRGDQQRRVDQDRRHEVRQHLGDQYPAAARAHAARGV